MADTPPVGNDGVSNEVIVERLNNVIEGQKELRSVVVTKDIYQTEMAGVRTAILNETQNRTQAIADVKVELVDKINDVKSYALNVNADLQRNNQETKEIQDKQDQRKFNARSGLLIAVVTVLGGGFVTLLVYAFEQYSHVK